jgi:hypothetical protein
MVRVLSPLERANLKRKRKAQPGTAGMYDADGNPIGTTTFTAEPGAQEWPLRGTSDSRTIM